MPLFCAGEPQEDSQMSLAGPEASLGSVKGLDLNCWGLLPRP